MKRIIEKICKIVQAEAKEHKGIWSPPCVGYAYQPKRPKQKSK